jgi:hypothetical protein
MLQALIRALDFDFASMRTLPQVLLVAAMLLLDATPADAADCMCDRLSAEGCTDGAKVREVPAEPPLWCERTDDPRPTLHACKHARHLRQRARTSGDELGSTDSMERASPHRQPIGCLGRRRRADRTLPPSRTTSSLAPAALFWAVVPAFGLFIRTLSFFQARREVVAGG